MTKSLLLFLAPFTLLLSCSSDPWAIPRPSRSVTPSEAIATAHFYTQVEWEPQVQHVKHGEDRNGTLVHTPDVSVNELGFANGWWSPGKPAKGVPYQWGGFDTPTQFLRSLRQGEFAGDISTTEKRALGDEATSAQACGIDCSGFVSRCWRLARPYSTRELPEICKPLKSWSHLSPGDILLNDKHVVLFAGWDENRSDSVLAYEAGPFPVWRVNAASIPIEKLRREGYAPWRYRGMK